MKKSTRHSKITGDFAEAFFLYWLSKNGYECARVDHTGIDLIARRPDSEEVLGISVKCRSRYEGKENEKINLEGTDFAKARQACEAFHCVPYYAILVESMKGITGFLLNLAHLEAIAYVGKTRPYWRMDSQSLEEYRRDRDIQRFELQTISCSWRDRISGTPGQDPLAELP
jgi:hypothetical protein